MSHSPESGLAERTRALDWKRVAADLDAVGFARAPGFLAEPECRSLAALWDDSKRFRKRIDLARHRFGEAGSYQYFAYPLPGPVEAIRHAFYPPLARIADVWRERLGSRERHPADLAGFLARCRRAGQTRPTPLLLRYAAGGFNRLHQDLYGEVAFPLQLAFLLSQPERDFRGGEFLLHEQRPREQARVEVVVLAQGDAIVFPNRERPTFGPRGFRRVQVRHGVARIHAGERTTLGVIFHDAK